MPRKPRTQSGAPGQPALAPPGVPYGEGERAIESQRRMPVPDFAAQGPAVSAPAGGGAPPGAPGGGQPDMNAIMQMAQAMPSPDEAPVMHAPTMRPTEEVNQPLRSRTPGTGQRVVPNEAIYELRALAQRYPYPGLLRFLERVELEGRQ